MFTTCVKCLKNWNEYFHSYVSLNDDERKKSHLLTPRILNHFAHGNSLDVLKFAETRMMYQLSAFRCYVTSNLPSLPLFSLSTQLQFLYTYVRSNIKLKKLPPNFFTHENVALNLCQIYPSPQTASPTSQPYFSLWVSMSVNRECASLSRRLW